MTTDKIIRDEFDKHYKVTDVRKRMAWRTVFLHAWKACEDWHERQNMMDRDYQEDKQEENRLAGGLG